MEYEDIIVNSYTTENEWYEFYNSYANLKGFSIRRDKVRYDKNGDLYYRKFVCFKEGIRETKHIDRADRTYKERALSRCNCDACLEIVFDNQTQRWFVYSLRDMHNHELAGPDEVPFLRSQRRVDDVQMEEIHMLAQCGIPKNKIMDFMEYRDGGYEKVGFIRKDIYNKWGKISRRIIEHGDAQTVLNMLEQRKKKDVDFFYLNKTDDEGHLTHMFWADSQSRVDYEAFGDVLLFDSTYRTNKYAMPFIPFIGLNHHRRTIIFGCGVVCNETTASYIWLLKAFKMAMCQKEPLSVTTDGDSAMREAIITEFPNVKHQLCCWHLGKNLYDNIRNRSVRAVFQDLISRKYTAEVFENKWIELLANKMGNKEKKWLIRMYEKKYLWAATYLHGHTFLGLRSTQRSESINSILHKYLNYGMTLVDMIHHYDRCVSGARRNEAADDSKASQFAPYPRTCMRKLELYAADIYTPAVFDLIQIDMQKGKNYCITGHTIVDGFHNFVITIDSNPKARTNVCCKWESGKLAKLTCECLQLETKGTPCCHMFSLMKYLKLTSFPECCIWPRWTKNVKAGFASDRHGTLNEVSNHAIRNQKLVKLAKQVCYKAAESEDQFSKLMNFLNSKLASFKLKENQSEAYNDYNSDDGTCEINVDDDGDTTIVLDPIRVKTKGAPRKRLKGYSEKRTNRCGMCNQQGHNIRSCPSISVNNVDKHDVNNDTGCYFPSDMTWSQEDYNLH